MLSARWGVAIVADGASRVVAAIVDRRNPHSRLLMLAFSTTIPVVVNFYICNSAKTPRWHQPQDGLTSSGGEKARSGLGNSARSEGLEPPTS